MSYLRTKNGAIFVFLDAVYLHKYKCINNPYLYISLPLNTQKNVFIIKNNYFHDALNQWNLVEPGHQNVVWPKKSLLENKSCPTLKSTFF